MKFKIKGARLAMLIVPALALAAPAFAQTGARPTTLSDSQEPGSVIVFPKFIRGTVTLPEGGTAPASELQIGVVCPKGVICPEHQPVKIRFHWVCGTTEADLGGSFVCPETDFDVTATVFEKIVLVPDGTVAGAVNTKTVPAAPCPRGYLIGWVEDTSDRPIKFDGLIGDADIRESGSSLADYGAIPIQANPALANAALITLNGNGALVFDGGTGHYQAVTGQIAGDVRYDSSVAPTFTRASLTLLTIDVKSNRPNNPVFVDLDFFGGLGSAIGNENQLSGSTEFICWGEIPLASISDGNLVQPLMGRKGVFVAAPASKVGIFGTPDDTGATTLLGLVETLEGTSSTAGFVTLRESIHPLFNSSVPVPTRFLPAISPIFLP